MSNGARRRSSRAYIIRIARSSSSTSAFSRRVAPTEASTSHASGVRRVGKLTPPGTRRCLGCVFTSGHVSASPFLYNNSQKSKVKSRTLRNADEAQGVPCSLVRPSARGHGVRVNTTFRGSGVWSLTPLVGPRDTNARRVSAFASFEPLQARSKHTPTELN